MDLSSGQTKLSKGDKTKKKSYFVVFNGVFRAVFQPGRLFLPPACSPLNRIFNVSRAVTAGATLALPMCHSTAFRVPIGWLAGLVRPIFMTFPWRIIYAWGTAGVSLGKGGNDTL